MFSTSMSLAVGTKKVKCVFVSVAFVFATCGGPFVVLRSEVRKRRGSLRFDE